MVWRSGRHQALGQIKGKRIGRGGHNSGRGNGDRGKNSGNHRVIFLQQGESNRTTHVPDIDVTTIDAECYYFHVPCHLSNNCLGVTVE